MSILLIALCLYPLPVQLPVATIQGQSQAPKAPISQLLQQFTSACKGMESEQIAEGKKNPRWYSLLDTVEQAALANIRSNPELTSSGLEASLSAFSKVLVKQRKPDSDIHSGLSVHYSKHRGMAAVSVSIGHVSTVRLVSIRTGKLLSIPSSLDWMSDYLPLPTWTDDGSLILTCSSIQDMGNRTGCKVLTCKIAGDQCVQRSAITRTLSLDFGSVYTTGNTVEVVSLDDPQAFTVSAATPLLGKTEKFHVENGALVLQSTKLSDPEIRAVDNWMFTARHSNHKDQRQRLFLTRVSSTGMLQNYKVSSRSSGVKLVHLDIDGVPLDFRVTRQSAALTVQWIK